VINPLVFDALRHRHGEPHRHHHTWARVAAMMALTEEVAHGIGDRPAFLLALLFHTAVFDRTHPGAAAESIALMRRVVAAPAARLDRAAMLIEAWARGELPETDDPSLRADAALLLDMDNVPLAGSPGAYVAYEAALRRESPHLSDDAWAHGRLSALRMMLWRDRIYRTDRFHLTHERQARRNIDAMLVRLGGA
jgi:predicted metal-dependent HD superfamily phosphohydrolase